MTLKRVHNLIPDDEARRLLDTGKALLDPLCPLDSWYRLPRDKTLEILLERGQQGYAARETQTSIILFQPR